jgi:hypothetical protein
MKRMFSVLILSVLLGAGGCKKKAENEELQVSVSKIATMISVPIQSCEDEIAGDPTVKSLAANAAKFSKVTFTWLGQDSVEIVKMTALFKSPMLKTGELKVDYEVTGVTLSNSTPFTTSCSLRMGGIELKDENTPAYKTGSLKTVGLVTDGSGNQRSVSKEIDIQLVYEP